MKPEELSQYIGEIDDELIVGAKKKRSANKKIFLITGSIAACALIAVTGVFLASGQNNPVEKSVAPYAGGYTEKGAEVSSGVTAGGADSEIPHTEESYDTDIEIITSDIFYVKEGKVEKTPVEHEATPQAVFELWKKMNNIGDEVKLISVKIDSNGSTEESEIDGQGVATYHVGDHFIYDLTISKSLESYYSMVDKNLLLDSLKQTMLDAADMKIDEYNLIPEEG